MANMKNNGQQQETLVKKYQKFEGISAKERAKKKKRGPKKTISTGPADLDSESFGSLNRYYNYEQYDEDGNFIGGEERENEQNYDMSLQEIAQQKENGVEISQKNYDMSLRSPIKGAENIGAVKLLIADMAENQLKLLKFLMNIKENYENDNPKPWCLEYGNNFQDFCNNLNQSISWISISYPTVIENIRHLNTFGEELFEALIIFDIPYRDRRRIKKLPVHQRKQVIGLIMSGHSENEEVKSLVKDLLDEIEEKDTALHQARNELQEAKTAEKVNLIEQRYTLESEKQDLQDEVKRQERAIQDRDEQLQKYHNLETANGKLELAEDILRRFNTLTRDIQALKYDQNEATETLANMMEQIAAASNNLSEIINMHFLGE